MSPRCLYNQWRGGWPEVASCAMYPFFGSTRLKPRLPWTSSNIHQINSIRKLRTLVLCSRPHLVRPCWIFRSFRSLVVLYPNPLDAYFPRSVLRSAWTVDGPTTALDQIPFYLRFHGPIQMSVYLHRRFHAMLKNLTRSLVMLTLLQPASYLVGTQRTRRGLFWGPLRHVCRMCPGSKGLQKIYGKGSGN